MDLTLRNLECVLKEKADGVLHKGSHSQYFRDARLRCHVCARELRALALGLPWSDHPDNVACASPTDAVCQKLNDAAWPSDEARTKACLPLALLSENSATPGWASKYVQRVVAEILPAGFRAAVRLLMPAGVYNPELIDEDVAMLYKGVMTGGTRIISGFGGYDEAPEWAACYKMACAYSAAGFVCSASNDGRTGITIQGRAVSITYAVCELAVAIGTSNDVLIGDEAILQKAVNILIECQNEKSNS